MSPRNVIINTIGFRVGLIRKRHGLINLYTGGPYTPRLPHTLGDGVNGHWAIVLDKQRSWIKDFCDKGLVGSRLDVWTFRIVIYTNHGRSLKLRPEKPFLEELAKHVKGK